MLWAECVLRCFVRKAPTNEEDTDVCSFVVGETFHLVGTAGPIKGQLAVYGVSGELKGPPVPSQALKTRIWTSYRCYRSVEATKCHETFFFSCCGARCRLCGKHPSGAIKGQSRLWPIFKCQVECQRRSSSRCFVPVVRVNDTRSFGVSS